MNITRKSPRKRLFTEPQTISQSSPSKMAKVMATDHKYVNTKSCVEVEITWLKKEIKDKKQKIHRRNKIIKTKKDLVKQWNEK